MLSYNRRGAESLQHKNNRLGDAPPNVAFIGLALAPPQRLRSAGHREPMNELAAKWRRLPQQQKTCFEEKAIVMSDSRARTTRSGLSNCTSASDLPPDHEAYLSSRQKKRLGQRRLDASLQHVAAHSVWNHGLALSDHMTPLKSSFVLDDLNSKNLTEAVEQVFAFDREVVQNNVTSEELLKPCWSDCGGLCKRSKHYDVVEKLTRSLQDNLSSGKLDTQATLLRFELASTEASSFGRSVVAKENDCSLSQRTVWYFLGCTCKRPLSHVLLQMFDAGAEALNFRVKNGLPEILTSQQLLEFLVTKRGGQCGNITATFHTFSTPFV